MTVNRQGRAWVTSSAAVGAACLIAACPAVAADIAPAEPAASPNAEQSAAWTGLYVGGHIGHAWGVSNWAASTPAGTFATGSFNLAQPLNSFEESGSFFEGVQIGYDYKLPNNLVVGAEADATFPAYPHPLTGVSIGNIATLASPPLGGLQSYSENVLSSGAFRARIGYAPGSWLFYATGGAAWTYNIRTLTQFSNGLSEDKNQFRWGWAAGAGVEAPVIPNWTARLEYLYTDYGGASVSFPAFGQRFASDFSVQELRLGLNYHFGDEPAGSEKDSKASAKGGSDFINFHAQFTGVWQGYPPIRSPYEGQFSIPGGGEGRETTDLTLYAGVRLWKGAEFWVDPEIDQGFGVGDAHGAAGFPSAEAYKLGLETPYARLQRYFVRQTIELGGAEEKVEADLNQFAGSTTADRLVLTAGRFFITDLFDTNKYVNNPKNDFLNWAFDNAGTFDYAGDGWGTTYGVAVEWYQGRWTLRGGVFDLSRTPAGGDSPLGGTLDPTSQQLEFVGEIEERHELFGQPGKLKITAFLEEGRMGAFSDAIAYIAANPAADPGTSIAAVRRWNTRPGVSLNVEQQVASDVGVFVRAGWADGALEPWDFTDIDKTVSAGVSISGTKWGRPDDRVGIAGVINNISGVYQEYLNLGGLGILIGDGKLPNPGLEKIIEAYYSYSATASTKLSFDYQFIDNPAYNSDRGPANVFAGRVHWQF